MHVRFVWLPISFFFMFQNEQKNNINYNNDVLLDPSYRCYIYMYITLVVCCWNKLFLSNFLKSSNVFVFKMVPVTRNVNGGLDFIFLVRFGGAAYYGPRWLFTASLENNENINMYLFSLQQATCCYKPLEVAC